MKTINSFFTQVLLFAVFFILSCTNGKKNHEPILSGRFILSVIEKDKNGTTIKSEAKSDSTFDSLFRGITYIPDNSEWNFVNDSVLIVRNLNNQTYQQDTVVYKISQKGDTMVLHSKEETVKFPLKMLSANRFELDFGDQTVTCQLNRKTQ